MHTILLYLKYLKVANPKPKKVTSAHTTAHSRRSSGACSTVTPVKVGKSDSHLLYWHYKSQTLNSSTDGIDIYTVLKISVNCVTIHDIHMYM